jgi:hypothetical protein
MTIINRTARPAVIGLVALMVVCATFTIVFVTSDSEATFASWNEGDKFALKGERDLGLNLETTNGMLVFADETSWLRNASLNDARMSGYTGTVTIFEVTDVTSDEYVLEATVASNISLAATLSLDGKLISTGLYITDWDDGYSHNPDNIMNISEATSVDGTFGFDTKIAAASNGTYVIHLEKSTMAIKSIDMEMTAYARGYLNVDNYANTTSDYDYANDIDTVNITSYDSFDSPISMDLSMSGSLDFEPYLTVLKDNPAKGDFWEQTSYVNGSFSWAGIFDMAGLPSNITDMFFDEDLAESGITGFPIDLAKIYNPSGSGIPVDNGTLEIEAMEVNPEFSCLGDATIDDPVYGTIDITKFGFRNASLDNYLQLWYYPEKGYIVGMEFHTPPAIYGLSLTFDMKSIPVGDAQQVADTIIDQVSEEQTYEEVAQTISSGEGGIPQMLLIALGVVAVAVVGVVGFFLLRKKKP